MVFKKLLLRLLGFRFIVIHDDVMFMARDERALNCAVRDYVDMLDSCGTNGFEI